MKRSGTHALKYTLVWKYPVSASTPAPNANCSDARYEAYTPSTASAEPSSVISE